jgi:hypothetical protein
MALGYDPIRRGDGPKLDDWRVPQMRQHLLSPLFISSGPETFSNNFVDARGMLM